MSKKQIDFERLAKGSELGLRLGDLAAYVNTSVSSFYRLRKEDDRMDRVIAESRSCAQAHVLDLLKRRCEAG